MRKLSYWALAGAVIVFVGGLASWLILYVGVAWLAHGIGSR
jgi:hypothetical protein